MTDPSNRKREPRKLIAGGLIAVAVVLVVIDGHVFHRALFGELGLSPGDVGLGLHEQTLHVAVPATGAALIVAVTVLLTLGLQRLFAKRGPLSKRRKLANGAGGILGPLTVVGVVLGTLAVARSLGFDPDFWSFVRTNPAVLAAVIAGCAGVMSTVTLAAVDRWHVGTVAACGAVALALAAAPTLYASDRWGADLGRRVADGATLQPGFNPLGLRIGRRCVDGVFDGRAVRGVHLLLGRVADTAFVVDLDRGGVMRLGQPLRIEDPVNDACAGDTPPPVDASDAQSLAKRFRPVLRFDRLEPWRPLEIEAFLGESFPDGAHRVCPAREACRAATRRPALRNESGVRLDLHDAAASPESSCHVGVLRDCDAGERSAIYYRVTARSNGRVYVDYWWFLRFNHFPYQDDPTAPCGGRRPPLVDANHEGDWEGVTVVVRADAPREIEAVVYSAHGHSFRYMRAAPELVDGRPVVYVACGSHAAYPRPCDDNCRQTQHACDAEPCREPTSGRAEATYDGAAEWGRNDDDACATPADAPCLRPLPQLVLGPGFSATGVPFTTWPGKWGDAGGPASPGLQTRYLMPSRQVRSIRISFGARHREGSLPRGSDR
jgi:hypothetical protein